MDLPKHADVVIVGAGPAGLSTAISLQKNGIDVVVLDAAADLSTTSRALIVHSKTLEQLSQFDVTHELLSRGVVLDGMCIRESNDLLTQFDFTKLEARFACILAIPQSETERVLYDKLVELGGRVYRECPVTDVINENDRCIVRVSNDDAKTSITASWVVAADGMHSVVRQSIGIDFVAGNSYEESFLLADVDMDWPLGRKHGHLFFSGHGFLLVIPLSKGQFRVIASLENPPHKATTDLVQRIVNERGPRDVVIHDVHWSSRFRIYQRLASTYRSGRVFLVGDAAHVHSPAGGQGMNLGIQDGVDLAGVLTKAIRGTATQEDLEAYTIRRRPLAEKVISLAQGMNTVVTLKGTFKRWLRNTVIRVLMRITPLKQKLVRRLAQLD